MHIDLDELIITPAPADLTGCSLAELRSIRDQYQDVENGLSYARRIVQGRLDTVSVELERRRDGAPDGLLQRLPDALAAHSRGPGLPRPMPDLEPPAWADDLLAGADEALPPTSLARLPELTDADLDTAAAGSSVVWSGSSPPPATSCTAPSIGCRTRWSGATAAARPSTTCCADPLVGAPGGAHCRVVGVRGCRGTLSWMSNDLDRRWHDLGEFIREQRNVGQLSLRKLSEMAGVSNPYLSQIERGLRRPSAEILQQIARALEISSETLYVRAGILDEPDGEVDVVGEIRRDPALTEEHKKMLVRIYHSFRKESEELAAEAGTAAAE